MFLFSLTLGTEGSGSVNREAEGVMIVVQDYSFTLGTFLMFQNKIHNRQYISCELFLLRDYRSLALEMLRNCFIGY